MLLLLIVLVCSDVADLKELLKEAAAKERRCVRGGVTVNHVCGVQLAGSDQGPDCAGDQPQNAPRRGLCCNVLCCGLACCLLFVAVIAREHICGRRLATR